jgi:transcriptional regulator with XRE-family HTH domain
VSAPKILGIPKRQMLGNAGTALLQVKNNRGLTLDEMAEVMGRSDEAIAQYIAGESEMGFTAWIRANEAWPELTERLEETAAERALRAKQRALDLDPPARRDKAA